MKDEPMEGGGHNGNTTNDCKSKNNSRAQMGNNNRITKLSMYARTFEEHTTKTHAPDPDPPHKIYRVCNISTRANDDDDDNIKRK